MFNVNSRTLSLISNSFSFFSRSLFKFLRYCVAVHSAKKDRCIHSFGDTILTGIHVKCQSARTDLSTDRALEKAHLAVYFDTLLEILHSKIIRHTQARKRIII